MNIKYCPECDKLMQMEMYLGRCDELDCEYFRWSGDSYEGRNTNCFCQLIGKGVCRQYADEEQVKCPLGKMLTECQNCGAKMHNKEGTER